MTINKLTIIAFYLLGVCAFAQNQQLEENLMALKQNQANNKQKIAQYTWTETQTIKPQGRGERHQGLQRADGQRSAAKD